MCKLHCTTRSSQTAARVLSTPLVFFKHVSICLRFNSGQKFKKKKKKRDDRVFWSILPLQTKSGRNKGAVAASTTAWRKTLNPEGRLFQELHFQPNKCHAPFQSRAAPLWTCPRHFSAAIENMEPTASFSSPSFFSILQNRRKSSRSQVRFLPSHKQTPKAHRKPQPLC